MDLNGVPLVICLTVFIVIGVNAALLVALRRGNEAGQIELLKRAASRARQPWKHEDEALKELSKRVADLKRGAADAQEQESAAALKGAGVQGRGDLERRLGAGGHASKPGDSEER